MIVALVKDLTFASKIREAATSAGQTLTIVRDLNSAIQILNSEQTSKLIIDLGLKEPDPFESIKAIQAINPDLAIYGFFSHVKEELESQAKALKINAMPRSKFFSKLAGILG